MHAVPLELAGELLTRLATMVTAGMQAASCAFGTRHLGDPSAATGGRSFLQSQRTFSDTGPACPPNELRCAVQDSVGWRWHSCPGLPHIWLHRNSHQVRAGIQTPPMLGPMSWRLVNNTGSLLHALQPGARRHGAELCTGTKRQLVRQVRCDGFCCPAELFLNNA